MIAIEDYLLQHAEANEEKLRMEIAAALYAHGPVSLRKAASITGVDWMKLQWYLGEEKGIETYTEEMLINDLKTLEQQKK
jgi:predicted HTH domain antitoxin